MKPESTFNKANLSTNHESEHVRSEPSSLASSEERAEDATEYVDFMVHDLSEDALAFIEREMPDYIDPQMPIPPLTFRVLRDAGIDYRVVDKKKSTVMLTGTAEDGSRTSIPYTHAEIIEFLKGIARDQRGAMLYEKMAAAAEETPDTTPQKHRLFWTPEQRRALAAAEGDVGQAENGPPLKEHEDTSTLSDSTEEHIKGTADTQSSTMLSEKYIDKDELDHVRTDGDYNRDVTVDDVLEATLRGKDEPHDSTVEDVLEATLRGKDEPHDSTVEDVLEATLRGANDRTSTLEEEPVQDAQKKINNFVEAESVETADSRFQSKGLGAGQVEDAKIVSETEHASEKKVNEQLEKPKNNKEGVADDEEASVKKKGSESVFFDSRFEKEFGLSSEALRSIDGFVRLSPAQQKMVFENLKEYADQGNDSFVAHVWEGIKEKVTGKEGSNVPRKGSRGMAAYGDVVRTLVMSADTYGPKVHEVEGKLVADFVDMSFDRAHRKEQKEVTDALNAAAHALTQTPASWQEGGAVMHTEDEWKITSFLKDRFMGGDAKHRGERTAYEARVAAYESSKDAFAKTLEAQGYAKGEIARKLIEIDGRVHQIRFIETNPEAAEVLKAAGVQEKGLLERVGQHWATGAGVSAGFGAVSRYALGQVMGFLGAPAFAGAMGGVRGWNKAAAETRERDRKARMGTKDDSEEALNIVEAAQVVEVGGKKREVGLTAKLEALNAEFGSVQTKLYEVLQSGDQEQFSRLLATEYEPLVERLAARATYTHDKLMENRIQFGDKKTFTANQTKLFEVLGTAQALLAEAALPEESRVGARLERYIGYREGAIAARRWNKQVRDASMGVVKGVGFSLAGALAVEYFKDDISNFGKRLNDGVSDRFKDVFSALPVSDVREKLTTTYTIARGDTMTQIIKEHIPEIKGMKPGLAQENAIANIFKSLTPEELNRVGVSSGDVNKIIAGKTLNLDELGKIIEGKKAFIEGAVTRFGDSPFGSASEDLGDFRGAAHEISSDALNADRTIRETTVEQVVPIGAYSDPSPMSGEEVQNIVDPLLEKKASVIETYFAQSVLTTLEWEHLEKLNAYTILRDHIRDVEQGTLEKRIGMVLEIFKNEPYGMTPDPKESVRTFMHRAFVEVVRRGDESKFQGVLNEAFREIDKTHI